MADLRLVQTCSACPEQYDVFDAEGHEVGYLRYRFGNFVARSPYKGPIVYTWTSDDSWAGSDLPQEHIDAALDAIARHIAGEVPCG